GRPGWWPNFIARRALRIFPLYYGALTVLFVLLPWLVRWSNPEFVTLQANQRWYWTYTVNLLAARTGGSGTPLYTSHLWSLSIEEQFYLIWPLIVWACRPRTLLRVAAFAVIAGLAFRLGLVLHDPLTARLVRALSRASLGKWGKYSYAIYLVHYPLLGAIEWKTAFYQREVALLGGSRLPSVLLLAAVTMSLSYVLGWLSYHLYEKRF